MKAVTRQRPKNANYSVSANPSHTNGAPLNVKSRIRVPDKQPQPSQRAKQPELQSKSEANGKMTKFRNLDDIPDFTNDFGKDKPDQEDDGCNNDHYGVSDPMLHYTPPSHYNRSPPKQHVVAGYVVGSYQREHASDKCPLSVPQGPPPLPAEELSARNRHTPSPQRRANPPLPRFDDNSCDSVDTDISDDDDDDGIRNNTSYFASRDDYHVDYTPGKGSGAAGQKSRVVKQARPVQKSYPAKQPVDHHDTADTRATKVTPEITYKPYTLQQYRKIKPQEYVEFGKLQPDLNSSELVAKRANAERIKQFSKNLNDFNRVAIKNGATAEEKEASHQVKVLSKREKALQFAQNVPKPKVIELKSVAQERSNVGLSSAPTSKIDELTSRHLQSKKQVDAIKKSMGL